MQLEGARILVTGATGGIGEFIAKNLYACGACPVLQGREGARLAALEKVIDPDGTRIARVAGDLTDAADRARIVEACARLDVKALVNNAGVGCFNRFDSTDIETVIATNVTGVMELTRGLVPRFRQLDEAMIVNVGSTFGTIGFPGYVAYCASKHAIKGFSEALKRELANTAIDVLYVSPRATGTAMNSDKADALNEALDVSVDPPQLVANAIIRAMKKGVARTQLGWPEKLQTRLNGLMPGLVDRVLTGQLETVERFLSDTASGSDRQLTSTRGETP